MINDKYIHIGVLLNATHIHTSPPPNGLLVYVRVRARVGNGHVVRTTAYGFFVCGFYYLVTPSHDRCVHSMLLELISC